MYEGGFKLWECARDLLDVMHSMVAGNELAIEGAAVLEAGCGAALPGALALTLGARELVLQDFNPSVLDKAAVSTLKLNGLWSHARADRVRLLSGDWANVNEHLKADARVFAIVWGVCAVCDA